MGLFSSKGSAQAQVDAARIPRHSSGWAKLSEHLKANDGLRFLDLGPTSAGNINFITTLGHSIYMANFAEDADRPEFKSQDADGKPCLDTGRFVSEIMDFAGRTFDVVALWDTLDYLPAELAQPVVDRLYDVVAPGGQLLAFFHSKPTGDDTAFTRYHLTDTAQTHMQRVGGHPVLQTYTNRQVETMFTQWSAHKFFLAKDALREVIVTR